MKMVRHEDMGRESKGVTLSGCVERGEESVRIGRGQIYGLPVIATGHEVIESLWRMAAAERNLFVLRHTLRE